MLDLIAFIIIASQWLQMQSTTSSSRSMLFQVYILVQITMTYSETKILVENGQARYLETSDANKIIAENVSDEIDNEATDTIGVHLNTNDTEEISGTRLRFHEMVRIYHDIWNTMLMGNAREVRAPNKFEQIMVNGDRPYRVHNQPDLHKLFRVITPLDIVRDTLKTVSTITKRRGLPASSVSSVKSLNYQSSPVRYMKERQYKTSRRRKKGISGKPVSSFIYKKSSKKNLIRKPVKR